MFPENVEEIQLSQLYEVLGYGKIENITAIAMCININIAVSKQGHPSGLSESAYNSPSQEQLGPGYI